MSLQDILSFKQATSKEQAIYSPPPEVTVKLLKHEEEIWREKRRFYHFGLVKKKSKIRKTYLEQYFYKVKNSLFAILVGPIDKIQTMKVNEGCYSICALLL